MKKFSLFSHLPQDKNGTFYSKIDDEISYPDDGNDSCFEYEDNSFWFHHRVKCILQVIKKYPYKGFLLDVGGGNGQVTKSLQDKSMKVCLVEPGKSGIDNALKRGVTCRVHALLKDAKFKPKSIGAVGLFDVLEHIKDEKTFLQVIKTCLQPNGYLYITVPAYLFLWSDHDRKAGHFRRYTRQSLEQVLAKNGFSTVFSTHFFSWLLFPQYITLKLIKKSINKRKSTFLKFPAGLSILFFFELLAIKMRISLPFGSSILCVARPHNSKSLINDKSTN
jgi:SAM-dependent methyltransferase